MGGGGNAIHSFTHSLAYLVNRVFYSQALHWKYEMKVYIVSVSQSSRRDKYTNIELQEYRTPKPYRAAKNIKDYLKGFIHLGKLHRIRGPVES